MLGYIAHGIANPAARLWLATSSQSWRHLPTPSDPPLVHAPGSDSDRVLLLGSGIAVGYGVMSHDLALGGHFARELSSLTGRGATVDIVGRPDMAPSNTRATLGTLDLGRFDALVLILGGLEALTLMPTGMWRRQMRALLAELVAVAPPSLKVFVVEIGAPLLAGLPVVVRKAVWSHLLRLNRATAELCAEFDNLAFVAFAPSQGDVNTLRGRTTYQGWAELIAPPVARALDAEARRRRPTNFDEESRQRAVDLLDIDSVPDDELHRIVANARDCGANMVLVKPVSPASLYDRLVWIAFNPRKFIDSKDYFGPDRRFKIEGYPNGVGRRAGDKAVDLGNAAGPALSQSDIDALLKATRNG